MRGDGDGWVLSDTGARFWGRHGAAGLLLRAPLPDGGRAVLLQHRAVWSHQGGTWGLPGGARDSHESPEETAVREAVEEAGLPVEHVNVVACVITATVSGSHWTYTTVVADAPHELDTVPNAESTELRWVVEDDVAAFTLHPGFAASWQRLRTEVAAVPLDPADASRHELPGTVELESGDFVWATAVHPQETASPLAGDVTSRLRSRRAGRERPPGDPRRR